MVITSHVLRDPSCSKELASKTNCSVSDETQIDFLHCVHTSMVETYLKAKFYFSDPSLSTCHCGKNCDSFVWFFWSLLLTTDLTCYLSEILQHMR